MSDEPASQSKQPSTTAQPAAASANATPVNTPPQSPVTPPTQTSTSSPASQSQATSPSQIGTLGSVGSGQSAAPPMTSPLAKPVPPDVNSNTTPQLPPPTKPGPVFIRDGAPIVPDKPKASVSAPEIVAQAGAVQLKSDGSKLVAETVDVNPQNPPTPAGYVYIIPNPDGKPATKFRGVCKKCGFQSFQPTELAAQQMIEYHAVKHLLGQ